MKKTVYNEFIPESEYRFDLLNEIYQNRFDRNMQNDASTKSFAFIFVQINTNSRP